MPKPTTTGTEKVAIPEQRTAVAPTSNDVPSKRWFNRANIFYPVVMHYISALIGYKELLGHGFALVAQDLAVKEGVTFDEALERIRARDPANASRVVDRVAAWSGPQELFSPLQLASASGEPVSVDFSFMAKEFFENGLWINRFWSSSACAALIMAYETAKGLGYCLGGDPTWEFLRHCRNAAGHGNRFTFLNNEPRRPAEWAGLRIECSLQGSRLFRTEQYEPCMLHPGDVIRLLADLEDKYPDMPASVG